MQFPRVGTSVLCLMFPWLLVHPVLSAKAEGGTGDRGSLSAFAPTEVTTGGEGLIRKTHQKKTMPAVEALEPRMYLSAVPLFVAPWGDDGGLGTLAAPYATLTGARDAIRQIKLDGNFPAEGVTVYLREGRYALESTFELTSQDSGTADAPIMYRAYPGESVQITGGAVLEGDWFTPVTSSSPVWGRLDASARGQVVQVDLAAHGITDYGSILPRAGWGWNNIAPMELFYDGQAMQVGQWPNDGYDTVKSTSDGRYAGTFVMDSTRAARLAQASDLVFSGLLGTYWYHSQVGGDVNPYTGEVRLDASPQYGVLPDMPYKVLNALEEIDQPGEYYVDRSSGMLYFWAPGSLDGADIQVSMMEDELVSIRDVKHVTFAGLAFESSRADLVTIQGGGHNTLFDCELRNAGTNGVHISGQDNGLEHCRVYSVGERGVTLSGGDRPTLTKAGNFVRNTEMYDWGRTVRTSEVAIHVEGVGQIISHNVLHDAPHTAIWYYGNEHLIEYNEIYEVCQETSDAGAIYAGRDWGYRGTEIRHNYIHDLSSPFTPWQIFGVYLDDAVSGSTVEGNIFRNIDGYATFNGGGRDNIWTNNIIAHAYGGHRTDRRGVDIITDIPGHDCNFLEKLRNASGGDFKSGAWGEAYPELQQIPETFDALGDFKNPGGTVFSRNLGYDLFDSSKWLNEGTWGGSGALDWYASVSNNSYGQDPLFVDEAGGDLNLQASSPAYSIAGWQEIPFQDIGLQAKPDLPDDLPGPQPTGPEDVIIDNADAGFSTVGSWGESGAVDEYNGSSLYSSTAGCSATWQADLGQDGVYEVFVWYSAAYRTGGSYNRDSLASYTVIDANGQTAVTVDQDVSHGQWVSIGQYEFLAGQPAAVTVAHDNEDRSATSADAVKFAYVADLAPEEPIPADIIIDDRSEDFSAVGYWRESGAVDEYEGGSLYANDIGDHAVWQPTIPRAGRYEVYACWSSVRSDGTRYDRDTAADYVISFDGGAETVTVDQTTDGGQWNLLGTFTFAVGSNGSVTVIRDAANGLATCADAVKFVWAGEAIEPVIVDNSDPGFWTTGDWRVSSATDAFGTESLYSQDPLGKARWQASLPVSGEYEVFVWYSRHYFSMEMDRDSHADYTVTSAAGSTAIEVDQDVNAGQWVSLGTYSFLADRLAEVTVRHDLEDGSPTVADAVKFVLI